MKTYEIGTSHDMHIVDADELYFRDNNYPIKNQDSLIFYREKEQVAVFIKWDYWKDVTEKNVDNCK